MSNPLATEARKKGCNLGGDALRQNVLGTRNGKPGWARSHRALAPYFDYPTEQWITPSKFPAMDEKWELES